MAPTAVLKENLKQQIEIDAFVTKDERELLDPDGKEFNWFFDLKGIMLKPGNLSAISELLWEHLKTRGDVQVGGLETVAIALTSGLVMRAAADGIDLNGFYIRKSRKRDGMQRDIEGSLTDAPIVLLDDALNSGKSIIRQVEVLKAAGKRVVEVCVLVAFRDPEYYEYFTAQDIAVWSLFTLKDFPKTGGMLQQSLDRTPPPRQRFTIEWKFESADPRRELILPKSAPVCDDERVYFGADNGAMWALNQQDGSVAWSHKILYGAGKKRIFSSPALHDGVLYFGAYDGNFYALDARTGAKRWINFDADWIGSSPCIAPELGMVFVGLEFGLWRKQGGIAALDLKTGEQRWWQPIETYVHSSPAYSPALGIVAVGSQRGTVHAYDARTGAQRWTYAGAADVRGGLAFDEARNLVIFGSWDDKIYFVHAKTGVLVHTIETFKPIYSSPIVRNGRLFMGVLDKRVLCVDLDTFAFVWTFQTQSRIFATPAFIGEHLFIGSNDGRLYELDPETGREISFFQVTERIVNRVAYNKTTNRIFLPTYANELYCLFPAIEPATEPIRAPAKQ